MSTTSTSPGPTATEGSASKPGRRARRVWGRPDLYTAYSQDMAFLNTRPKMLGVLAIIAVAAYLPLAVADDLLGLLGKGLVLAIGAIGLNLLTGYAGQVSLGHAFFVGVGAYTASALNGDPEGRYLGFGIDNVFVWIVGAGLVAALCGLVVAPLATRLRGLYLAVVTLGLLLIGQYIFGEWNELTGGVEGSRPAPRPVVFGNELYRDGTYTEEQKLFWFFLVVLIIMAVLARNIGRSKIGRAFAAVRDRDIAAGVMGVELSKYKLIAFTISSFYAGVCGALLYCQIGIFSEAEFDLEMSVLFIAMILIGGVATVSGAIMGAMLLALLPRLASELPRFLSFISTDINTHPNVDDVEILVYGGLIIAFLLFEPRGLFGIWLRIRTYWKSFPFSY